MPLSKITNPSLANGNVKVEVTANSYNYSVGSNEYFRISQYWDSVTSKPTVSVGFNTNSPGRAVHIKGVGATGSAEQIFEQGPLNGTTPILANNKIWNIVVDGGTANTGANFALRKLTDSLDGNTSAGFVVNGNTSIFTTYGGRTISPASVPPGSVIQVVQRADLSGYFASSGTASTLDVTGYTLSITPQFSTSKILLMLTVGAKFVCDGRLYFYRSVPSPFQSVSFGDTFREMSWDATVDMTPITIQYLDSPGTTSAITYQLRAAATGCSQVLAVGSSGDFSCVWTAMEIAA